MTDLVQRHPAEVLRVVWLGAQARRQIRADDDVRAALRTADGIAAEHDAAGGRHVVDDDVRSVLVFGGAGAAAIAGLVLTFIRREREV